MYSAPVSIPNSLQFLSGRVKALEDCRGPESGHQTRDLYAHQTGSLLPT